jgi:hypothetical protein
MDPTQIWSKIRVNSAGADVLGVTQPGNADAIEGSTMFFRHPDLFDHLVTYLERAELAHDPKILVAPSSVGCEAYSLAMTAMRRGLYDRYPDMKIFALDIAPDYIEAGRLGVFPQTFFKGVSGQCARHFEPVSGAPDYWRIANDIRARVTFLPAQDIARHKPQDAPYDVALCLNLIQHLVYRPPVLRGIIAQLLRTAQLTCVNHASYIDVETLRMTFAKVSVDADFAPLDADLRPLAPLGVSDRPAALERFRRNRTSADEVFIHRHRLA